MGIIRDLISHRPYFSPDCPSIYVFEVEILNVQQPGNQPTAVPLATCRLSGERIWMLQDEFSSKSFSLQPVDNDPSAMYILSLT